MFGLLALVLPPVRAVLPRPWHVLYPPVPLTTDVAPAVHTVDKSVRVPQVKGQVSPVPRPSQHTHKHQQAHNVTARPLLEGPTELRGRNPGTLKTILVGHHGAKWWTTERMRLIKMGDSLHVRPHVFGELIIYLMRSQSDLDLKTYSVAYSKKACKHNTFPKYINISTYFPRTWIHIHHRTRFTRPFPGKEPVYAL